eukprot:TRINITY_DN8293_c0_g1_i1.p2 TRINITY_DN8293_c0_g1~~TRINITY_DN8293_c0_g1_i1.p2  ORF type:complete len:117 (+),score=68.96 TRINITY_DN8293_c0_g1_i1:57-407(+)
MKVIAAYLLVTLSGNRNPDEAAINKVLSSVGADAKAADRVGALLAELKGKNLAEVIEAGAAKIASVPAGGAAPAAAAAAPAAAPAAAKEEKKKEEKKKEEPKEEEEDADMGFGLFD